MLLNQVKGNLDRNLLDQNQFIAQEEPLSLNKTMEQAVEMLKL